MKKSLFRRIPLAKTLPRAFQKWQQDDGPLMAAAVAYYAALSFFPLVLVLISACGLLLEYTDPGRDAERQVLAAISDYASPDVRDDVARMLKQVQRKAVVGGPFGAVFLLFAAAALFVHFERAFDRIWNVPAAGRQRFLRTVKTVVQQRMRAFIMLLCIGGLLLVVFLTGVALSSARALAGEWPNYVKWLWAVVETGTNVALHSVAFTLLYKLVPKAPVRWSEAFRGGLLAAVAWEVGRLLLTAYLIGDRYSAYGVVGSFIAVMLWIYFGSAVIFLGGEYVQVICRYCRR